MIRSTLKRGLSKLLGKEELSPAPRNYPFQYTPGAEEEPARKAEAPKVEPAKVEPPKVEAAKVEAPKAEAPKAEAPKVEATDDTAGPAFSLDEIQSLLDEMVRPALQGDGGDITLIKVEGNDIYVKLVGSCSTCPSSIATMKMGVEALFREEFPNMGQLIQVD